MCNARIHRKPKIKSLVLGIALWASSGAVLIQSAAAATVQHTTGTNFLAIASWDLSGTETCASGVLSSLSPFSAPSSARKRREIALLPDTVQVSFFSFDSCTGTFTSWTGSADTGISLSSNPALLQASASATVPFSGTVFDGVNFTPVEGSVVLDVSWVGTGAVSRTLFKSRSQSPDSLFVSKGDGSSRAATASGSVTFGRGPNLIPGPTQQATLISGTGSQLSIQH